MIRFLVGLAVQTILVAAFILGPAWAITGNLDWPRGWLTIAILFVASIAGGLWLLKEDPDLARERASVPRPQTRGDAIATVIIVLSTVAWFAAAGWDALRLQLLVLPSAVSLWVGVVIFAISLGVVFWTLSANSFAASVVKIQNERKQRVIDTGPYAFVRHPMYTGAILSFAGMGLLLGSAAAALAALPLFAIAFLPRMLVEEAALRRGLAGYLDYETRVRARLLPWLF